MIVNHIFMTSPIWLAVGPQPLKGVLFSIVLNMCPFDYTALISVNRFNHTSWMTVVTPTDRSKSVRNRYVIEAFGGVFVLSIGFRIFRWCKGFCHKTEADLLLFLIHDIL